MDIWIWYRGIIGSTMLVLLAFGGFFIGFGITLAFQIGHVLEGQSKDRNNDIRLTTNLSIETLPGKVLLNETRNLNKPPIPFKVPAEHITGKPFSWPMFTAYILIGVGIVAIILSILGAYAAYRKKTLFIILFTIPMTIFVLVQFSFLHFHISTNSLILQDARGSVMASLLDHYEVGADARNQVTFSLNAAMLAYNCCGVAGPADFLFKEYTYAWAYTETSFETRAVGNGAKKGRMSGGKESATFYKAVKFPPACCKAEIRDKGFDELLKCAASGDEKLINNKGCFPAIFEHFLREHGEAALDAFLYIIGFEVLQIILVTTLVHIPKQYETEAIKLAIEYAEMIQKQTQALMVQATEENETLLQAMDEIDSRRSHENDQIACDRDSLNELSRRYVFVPFAKVPSAAGSNSSTSITDRRDRPRRRRILSTEIW
ncbi:tetraspanin [Elysia marginata]|uniref:Tetraspanin n=1 Tax=Elysia marginata TaxID=1093978 RepID=A0AAV4ESQ3_9GAST|nr:tetraspanin [Elysia marginata]